MHLNQHRPSSSYAISSFYFGRQIELIKAKKGKILLQGRITFLQNKDLPSYLHKVLRNEN